MVIYIYYYIYMYNYTNTCDYNHVYIRYSCYSNPKVTIILMI